MLNRVLCIAICAVATIGHVHAQTTTFSALSASGGRYVFGQISEYRRDQLMLDTQTGRLWQMACFQKDPTDLKTCIEFGLQPVPFLNARGEIHGSVPPAPPASKP